MSANIIYYNETKDEPQNEDAWFAGFAAAIAERAAQLTPIPGDEQILKLTVATFFAGSSQVVSDTTSLVIGREDNSQISIGGTHSTLFVDVDGGADNFTEVATLFNVTGLTDEEALETSGNLIAA